MLRQHGEVAVVVLRAHPVAPLERPGLPDVMRLPGLPPRRKGRRQGIEEAAVLPVRIPPAQPKHGQHRQSVGRQCGTALRGGAGLRDKTK